MVRQMVGHEGRDEVVAVVIAGLAAELQLLPPSAQAASKSSGLSCPSRNLSAVPTSTKISAGGERYSGEQMRNLDSER